MLYPFGDALRVLELEAPQLLQAAPGSDLTSAALISSRFASRESAVSTSFHHLLSVDSALGFVMSQLTQHVSDSSELSPDTPLAATGLD